MTSIEETSEFRLRFDASGLITAVVVDRSGNVLMVAHMNEDALRATRSKGLATFWSRSRQSLWTKGETSGNTMRLLEIRVDCDQDCLLLVVAPEGNGRACHTGRETCFYRRLESDRLIVDD